MWGIVVALLLALGFCPPRFQGKEGNSSNSPSAKERQQERASHFIQM